MNRSIEAAAPITLTLFDIFIHVPPFFFFFIFYTIYSSLLPIFKPLFVYPVSFSSPVQSLSTVFYAFFSLSTCFFTLLLWFPSLLVS